MNLIHAKLVREAGRAAVRVLLADGSAATLELPSPALAAAYAGDDVVLGLRPEAITDGANANPSAAPVFVENRIDLVEPAGSDTFVVTRMGGADVVARLRADAKPRPGAAFRFAIEMDKCVLFDPGTQARIA